MGTDSALVEGTTDAEEAGERDLLTAELGAVEF